MLLKNKIILEQYKTLVHLLNFKFTVSKNLYLIYLFPSKKNLNINLFLKNKEQVIGMNNIKMFFNWKDPFILSRFCYKGYFVNSEYTQLELYYKFFNYFEVLIFIWYWFFIFYLFFWKILVFILCNLKVNFEIQNLLLKKSNDEKN